MDARLTHLDFTHVFYDPSDLLSLPLAISSLIPQLILVVYTTQFFCRREIETCLMVAGQVLSELLNELLKSVIRQPRPHLELGSGYGMPSAHAQFMAFYATYLTAWTLAHAHFSPLKKALRITSGRGSGRARVLLSRLLKLPHPGAGRRRHRGGRSFWPGLAPRGAFHALDWLGRLGS